MARGGGRRGGKPWKLTEKREDAWNAYCMDGHFAHLEQMTRKYGRRMHSSRVGPDQLRRMLKEVQTHLGLAIRRDLKTRR